MEMPSVGVVSIMFCASVTLASWKLTFGDHNTSSFYSINIGSIDWCNLPEELKENPFLSQIVSTVWNIFIIQSKENIQINNQFSWVDFKLTIIHYFLSSDSTLFLHNNVLILKIVNNNIA